jgi:hypothetical protein
MAAKINNYKFLSMVLKTKLVHYWKNTVGKLGL